MKKIVFTFLCILTTTIGFGQLSADTAIASCCEEGRGCKGSAYCSACTNCSGCRHCAKNGGSCGVCSSGSRSYTRTKKVTISKPSISKNEFMIGSPVYVKTKTLNLREGPGIKYQIIKELTLNTSLIIMERKGKWLKVNIENTEIMGYVYYKYVRRAKL